MSLNRKISPESASSVNSELDLFAIDPTQTQIEEGLWETIEATDFSVRSTQLKFLIGEDDRHFVDLSECSVEIECKIKLTNGTDLDVAANNVRVYPEDNFAHTLFSKATLMINSQTVEFQDRYAEKAYIENLVNTDQSVKETTLAIEGWMEDGGRASNGGDTPQAASNARKAMIAGSNTLAFSMRPRLAMFQQDKMIPPGTSLTLLLDKSEPRFALRAGVHNPPGGGRVNITSARLRIRKCKLIDSANIAILKTWTGYKTPSGKFVSGVPAKYNHKKASVHRHTFPQNATNQSVTLTHVRRPSRVFCALTNDQAVAGNYLMSPFNFVNAGVTRLALKVDGRLVDDEFRPDFANNKVTREYQSFIQACGKQHFHNSNGITKEDFITGTTLFGWDLSRGLSNQLELVQDVQMRFEFTFGAPLPHTMSLITYTEYDEYMQLSRGQQPIVV